MFKFLVLLSVAAMAAAKPGVLAPVVVSSVIPGSSSLSEYSTSINHGSPLLYRAPAVVSAPVVVSAPAVVPLHSLHKRSIGVAPWSYGAVVSPVSYATPLVSSHVGSVALSAPLGLSAAYPRALSWHPY